MGKLTGPPKNPPFQKGTKDDPCAESAEKEGGGQNAQSLDAAAAENSKSGKDDRKQISFKRRCEQNSELTTSMIKLVNNAAETARLVLDQAALKETTADDNKSISSHGSRRSAGSNQSIHSYHSYNSRRSSGSKNGAGAGDSRSGDGVDLDDSDNVDGDAQMEELTSGENSLLKSEASGTIGASPFSPPPPTAFQNLPMARGFDPSHKSDVKEDVLAEGKVFEVTNHFDAAAAISAALASSHLAQAAGNIGELKLSKHAYPACRRRSSAGEDFCSNHLQPTRALRRANSGDAITDYLKCVENSDTSGSESGKQGDSPRQRRSLPSPDEAVAEMLLNRTSFSTVDDLSLGSSDNGKTKEVEGGLQSSSDNHSGVIREELAANKDDTIQKAKLTKNVSTGKDPGGKPRRPSAGLPSREEAEAEMLSKRSSFLSVDDWSCGSDQAKMLASLKAKLKRGEPLDKGKGNIEPSTNDKDAKNDVDRSEQKDAQESQKIVPLKSDDSTSNCSSSGYENESNTSSVYQSSAASPLTMSTAGGSGVNKASAASGGNNKGMLGNLASQRRANLGDSTHTYDGVDDEYSTQSDNSGGRLNAGGKQHLPQRSKAEMDAESKAVSKTVTFSTKSASVLGPRNTTASTDKKKHQPDVQRESSEQTQHPAPAHRASLFDSFDRNWEQAVQGSERPDELLDLGRKCLVSFACVFGSFMNSGRSSGDARSNGEAEEKLSFRWWMDDDAVTNVGSVRLRSSVSEAGVGEQGDSDAEGIPIVVVRTLWKSCFFGTEDQGKSVDSTIDLIQNLLVNELCHLATVATPSALCLRLSLNVVGREYGWYILRRFGLQDDSYSIASWHSKFSTALRRKLLDDSLTDADAMITRRYAALSLPRHTAMGHVNSEGLLDKDAIDEEKRLNLRSNLFRRLLCDEDFIKSRAKLLGRGNMQQGNIDKLVAEGGATPPIAKLIKQIRSSDRNMLFPTIVHMKDVEWCTSLCVADCNEVDEGAHKDEKDSGASSNTDCLDAMSQWEKELITSFHYLRDCGKLTICDNTASESKVLPERKDPSPSDRLTQSMSLYYDENDDGKSPKAGNVCVEAAKSLLAADDAWTMKDDSADILQGGSHSKNVSTPRPPRKSRRKRTDPKEGTASKTTSLARLLKIHVSDVRTAVTIGRSLLGLAEFSQFLDKEIINKNVKDRSVKSHIYKLQSSCLKNAIEILSCAAKTLGYILSSCLENLDDDDLDETVTESGPHLQLFAMTREASKPLLSVAGILCADAWFALGNLVSKASKADDAAHVMMFSFERALLILNSKKSASLNKHALDLLCESLLSPLTQYKCFLQSNINHSVGVHSYEQGDFERASEYLDKSSRFRRQMLDELRIRCQDGDTEDEVNGLSKLFNAVVGGMKSSYLSSPSSMSEELFTNIFKYSIGHGSLQLPRDSFAVEDLELSLSLTLEYSALTQHAQQSYQQALSLFQESLILRTMHVGKHSLDVASLHFNMGVVYDDLEQYDQAISRYHESLRIRLDHLNKATSSKINSELEDSVLLTLKCMGHVYKIVNDMDNAVCCHVKALEMVNKKFKTYREPADEWSKMGLRLGMAVPVPTVIFDEFKATAGNTSWKAHFQMMNKKELCHIFDQSTVGKRRSRSTVSKLKKELAKLHLTVIEIVNERKQKNWEEEGSSRSKVAGSSLLLASLSSTLKTGGDAFEAALMRSSFCLGRLKLEQMRYEEAADYLESALRSKWVLDPASSSDSDSDFSRKSLSSRSKHQSKCMDEDDPEEGQIYYSLGVCNAALDDHERAVRCFLTAMRYLRRSLRKVDSLEVARVLFDCATSHYYLCNFEQSVSLYVECLRILDSNDNSSDEEKGNEEKAPPGKEDGSYRRGIVLYCLVMAKAAIDFDSETSNLLNEAQTLLSGCNDKIILSYLEFFTGLFLHHAASQVPSRLRTITKISLTGLSLNEGLSWNAMCQSALTLLEQVKNECWFDPLEGVEDSDEVKHLPLSGHICFKKGQIYELIDMMDQALNSYVDAANFYRIACGDENMYVASVLHRMGMICSQRTEYHALGYFNEALSIRKNLLGGNDRLVADTLFASAEIFARLNRYEASMERYHEALRIQMADSQDSNEVARTLAGMGTCHYNHKAYDLALTCFEGAVKIRKYRVSRLTEAADLVELYGEEVNLGQDFFNSGNVHMQTGNFAQAMQCFIQSRDLRWRHVGSGTVEKILHKYATEVTVDEDELLGLAHCLHNIGVMFDIKGDYERSLPHYEEALAIKNAIAGFDDSTLLVGQVNPEQNRALVLRSLHKDHEFPRINKATLSASMTRQRIATVYLKQRKYDLALFQFSHALAIQRNVLGKDNFRIGLILTSMGKALRRTAKHSDTAIMCYNESLRISKLRFGQNHASVASALFDIGSLHACNENFGKAKDYYQSALDVYKQKYSQELRQRMCSGLDRPRGLSGSGGASTEFLSNGDEIIVAGDASKPEKEIREQYARVTEALRKVKRLDILHRGEHISCVGDSDDAWLTFEVLLFRFVEMLSTYIVDPAQTAMRNTIDGSRRRIESAAAHAVINAADALDYQFLLLLQE